MLKKIFAWLLSLSFLAVPVVKAEREEETLRLPVVMYHHISRRSSTWNKYVVSVEEFESDMAWLDQNGWQSISMRQLLDWQNGTFEMPEKPFMITFDDGFESTMAYAEPVLAQYGFCGVAAVIGAVCEKFSALEEHDAELSNLSWEDAAAMAERGVIEVQCHTWDMHELSPRTGCNKLRWENVADYRVTLSRDLSRFLTGCEKNGLDIVPSIAYPYGAYCDATTDVVRDMGFLAAFTCDEQVNVLSGEEEELFHLARFNRPHGKTSEKFFSKWEENA